MIQLTISIMLGQGKLKARLIQKLVAVWLLGLQALPEICFAFTFRVSNLLFQSELKYYFK